MRLELAYNDPSINVKLYNDEHSTSCVDDISTTVSEYQKKLQTFGTQLENSLLPPAVRYIDHARGIVLFERPPMYVNFNFSSKYQHHLKTDNISHQRLNLPVPWQRYVLFLAPNGRPHKVFIFFANSKITSLDNDFMSYAPLPNIYTDASLCLPVYNHVDAENFNLMDAISNVYDTVWKSGFNSDIFQAATYWISSMKDINRNNMVEFNPIANNGFEYQEVWYSKWASYSLDEIMDFSWKLRAYDSFNSLVSAKYESFITDPYDNVVNLYLAAKA